MIITDLLKDLSEKGIQLWVEGDNLRYRAPQGVLTPAILDIWRHYKAEIIEYLRLVETPEKSSLRPLSHGQKALWFLYELAPDSVAYNLFSTVRISSVVDINKLNFIWQTLLERHPILRTVYKTHNSQAVQALKDTKVNIPLINAVSWSEDNLQTEILAEADRPFNLEGGPIVRLSLYARSPQQYILLLVIHHIAFDFWSFDLLIHEFRILYQEVVQKGQNFSPHCLPPCLSYTDYTNWLERKLDSLEGERLWDYWQEKLAGELPVLHLPTDRTRPPVQTYAGANYTVNLDEKLFQQLKVLAKAEATTLYTILMAVFQVLLYRYTGQEDLLVGTPTLGRDHAEFEGIVGYFTNPVVVRGDASLNPTFKEFLARIRQTVLEALSNAAYPFPLLVEKLNVERDPSRSPIFQVCFTFNELRRDTLTQDSRVSELKIKPLAMGQRGAIFDLDLRVLNQSDSLVLNWVYNTDLFEAATIERMAGHFQILLERVLVNPKQPISDLPLLTDLERHQLLIEWNNTWSEYPQDKCIHQLLEEQVERSPDAVAVVFEGEQLTYRELNAKANQLAHYLQGLGVGPEELVGICVERSVEMVIGLLGILKAGGAYVPIDPAYPPERIAYMLDDSQLPVLLTQKKLAASLPEHQARFVCLDTDWKEISKESELSPLTGVRPENLAYVIYTSGSTGKPKGVLISHSSLLNLVFWHQRAFEVTSSDRATQLAGTAFDASVWEIWPYLASGASIYLSEPAILLSPEKLRDWLLAKEITITFVPTPIAEKLLSLQWPGDGALRIMLTGGDQLHQYPSHSIPFTVVNNYGPTENTVVTTSGLVVRDGRDNRFPPIGRPIANTQIYILDPQNQPVPIGVPGEIHIAGVGLAKGYLYRPQLTDEKFIPNPFSNEPGSRLYKTGDLARYLTDGNIEYLGRIDDQVKVRGFRIELGEIEAALSQHPSLLSATVVLREDIPGQKSLVAYIVPVQDSAPTVGELRGFLKQQLPDYMVPSAFVMLEALPLTPNGKVDRRALPAPEKRNELEESFVAPRTPIEEMLASIWSNILSIDSVGIHDNFFELGGHSLLATQVISRVRDTLTVELPLRTLFEAPTVAGLAERVEYSLKNGQSVEALPLVPIPRSESIPLSFAQARLWFFDQLQPDSAFYNIPLALRLSGQLNIAALENSINEIIQRHEALRTNFATVEGQPIQVIASNPNWELQVVSLLHLTENEREAEAQRWVNEEANRAFNLEREFLLRGLVLQLGETEYVLLFTMHHIISDGWSLGVFVQELAELYKAFCMENPLVLPSLPVQYADFAVWQQQWLSGEIRVQQLDYWKQQLLNAPVLLELPADRPRPAVQTFRGGYYRAALSQELSVALTALSKRAGVTLFIALLAAFQTLLYRLSRQDDIVVGTPVAGRNRQEIEGLIGFFVNTLVLRTDLSGNPTFEELLGRVREVALGAYTHQDLPFEQLVEVLQPERSLSYTPLFQVMFALDDALVPTVELPELTISSYPVEIGTAKFDLTLSMENTASGLVAEWEYSTELFDESTIARIARNFQTLLEGIVVNSKQKISELPLLTETERHQLLVEWNNTWAEYPQDKCIHQLFEEQVERSPDAVAVVFEGEQLTYRELNAKANQLAHYLRALGVGPEVLVGICVERSLEMVIGLLGILKAGGAYVPLDPNYPSERLAFMLEDSSVPVLLTQQKLVEKLPSNPTRVVCLDSDWEEIAAYSEKNPNSPVRPQNLAYVIYTSGSTGKPKGVLIEHRALVNYTTVANAEYGIQERDNATHRCRDRILQFSSISFDVSAEEIYTSLTSGATLVLRTDSMLDSLEGFLQKCNNWEITVVAIPTAYWHELTTFLSQEKVAIPPSLRLIIIGGEKALPERLKTWFECVGQQVRLVNNYGPTETTVGATICELSAADATLRELPIGRPLGNVQTYILDENRQPLPIGVPGELHIGGAGLARGYLNRPKLTEEKFIPSPFSNEPASRLYKTGDLTRYLSDGNIEYLGRIDNQVKIRGFRIELGEIEAVLSQHPNAREVAVIHREDTPGNKRLVAYVVSNLIPDRIPYHTECQLELNGNAIPIQTQDISTGGVGLLEVPVLDEGSSVRLHLQLPGEDELRWLSGTVVWSLPPQAGIRFHLTPNEQGHINRSVAYQLEIQELWKTLQRTVTRNLRDYLKQKLPDYMIPSAFVLIEALPLTPNGKIDRRALPAPDSFNSQNESCFVGPHDTLELQLSQIWSEVLGVYPVGVRDNFFTLGGHSLLAVRLMAHLEQQLGKNLPLATLFSSPTIEQLAIHLRSLKDSKNWSPLIPVQSKGSRLPLFCIPGVGGDVLYFYELARHLGSEQPFYGLQARGLDGESEPFTQVEDMAACYIEALQAIQSEGPYLLGGHSFGGLVAFEIAQQLQKQGQKVALVAIMDTVAPILSEKEIEINEKEGDFTEFIHYLEYMFSTKFNLSKEIITSLNREELFSYIDEKWRKVSWLPKNIENVANRSLKILWKVYEANAKSHRNYCPKQILPTRISVFRAAEIRRIDGKAETLTDLLKDPALGWRKFSTTNENYVIPGNHITMMKNPHVKVLAAQLKISLDIAQSP